MIKLSRIILASTLLLTASARAQSYTYTNAPSGSSLNLTGEWSFYTIPTNQNESVVITYDSGAGSGTLTGTGTFMVTNTVDASSHGGEILGGVLALTLTNTYSGAMTVLQDLSAHTNALDGYAYGYDADLFGDLDGSVTVGIVGATYTNMTSPANSTNHATGVGIIGSLSGNLSAPVTVDTVGGIAVGDNTSEQNAGAFAYSVVADIGGDVSGAVSATARAQQASGNLGWASSEAYAIVGNIGGSVNADVTADAIGGTSTGITSFATSYADAIGIVGSITNDVTGNITATAQGGSAVAGGTDAASADAIATGILGDIGGTLSGQILATAQGGTAENSSTGGETATATAIGIDSSGVPNSQFSLSGGGITASATGGTIGSTTNGGLATAYGISADGLTLDIVSGDVSADAVGSNATAAAIMGANVVLDLNANSLVAQATGFAATAHGISAGPLMLDINSGDISALASGSNSTATAIMGTTVDVQGSGSITAQASGDTSTATGISATALTMTNSGVIAASASGSNATATAIQATSVNLLMDSGTLSALENGIASTAINAGSGSVYLGDVDVAGDVGTLDLLSVFGDSSINGDISATDTSIENGGSLSFVNEQAIMSGDLTVRSNATLSVILTPADTGATALDVSGSVTVEDTGRLNVTVPHGTAIGTVLSNSYRAVGATATTGTFEGLYSLYTFSLTNLADGVWITIDGVAQQVGGSTPAVANAYVSLGRSTLGMMSDISSRLESVRSVLRDPADNAAPIGTLGPGNPGSGEWTAYLHQINHRGEQEGNIDVDGYSFKSHGFLFGTEKGFDKQMLIGANVGYIYSGFDGDISQQEGSSGMIAANLYGDWVKDVWHWGAGLTLASSNTDTERQDSGGEYYKGDFDSTYLGGWLDGSYAIHSDSMTYEPYGRTAYLNSEHDGYTDSGGGAPLSVGDNTVDNWITEVGVKVSKTWHRKKDKDEFELSLKAGWLQEWLDNQVIIDNAALGGIPQVYESVESSDSALVLAITETWFASDRLTMGFTYQPVISENWYYHSFGFNLDYSF